MASRIDCTSIRDLINYAYRDYFAEARVVGDAALFAPVLEIEASHGEL